MTRHIKLVGRVGLGQSDCGSKGVLEKLGHFKWVRNKSGQSGYWSSHVNKVVGQVDSNFTWNFFDKEKEMYLLFGKSYSKLLDIKYITLNSPLISRIISAKQINTCSIILKLYKFQYY